MSDGTCHAVDSANRRVGVARGLSEILLLEWGTFPVHPKLSPHAIGRRACRASAPLRAQSVLGVATHHARSSVRSVLVRAEWSSRAGRRHTERHIRVERRASRFSTSPHGTVTTGRLQAIASLTILGEPSWREVTNRQSAALIFRATSACGAEESVSSLANGWLCRSSLIAAWASGRFLTAHVRSLLWTFTPALKRTTGWDSLQPSLERASARVRGAKTLSSTPLGMISALLRSGVGRAVRRLWLLTTKGLSSPRRHQTD